MKKYPNPLYRQILESKSNTDILDLPCYRRDLLRRYTREYMKNPQVWSMSRQLRFCKLALQGYSVKEIQLKLSLQISKATICARLRSLHFKLYGIIQHCPCKFHTWKRNSGVIADIVELEDSNYKREAVLDYHYQLSTKLKTTLAWRPVFDKNTGEVKIRLR